MSTGGVRTSPPERGWLDEKKVAAVLVDKAAVALPSAAAHGYRKALRCLEPEQTAKCAAIAFSTSADRRADIYLAEGNR